MTTRYFACELTEQGYDVIAYSKTLRFLPLQFFLENDNSVLIVRHYEQGALITQNVIPHLTALLLLEFATPQTWQDETHVFSVLYNLKDSYRNEGKAFKYCFGESFLHDATLKRSLETKYSALAFEMILAAYNAGAKGKMLNEYAAFCEAKCLQDAIAEFNQLAHKTECKHSLTFDTCSLCSHVILNVGFFKPTFKRMDKITNTQSGRIETRYDHNTGMTTKSKA